VPRRVPAEDAGDVRGDGAGAGRVRGGVRPARACGEVVDRRGRRLHRGDRGPAGEPRLRRAEADGELLLPRPVAALAEPRPEAVAGVVDPAERRPGRTRLRPDAAVRHRPDDVPGSPGLLGPRVLRKDTGGQLSVVFEPQRHRDTEKTKTRKGRTRRETGS